MSNVKIKANTSGSADFTIEAPATDSALTLTLPSVAGELLTTTGDGSQLTGISGGKVLQVVTGHRSDVLSTQSTSFVNTGLSASITPSSTSSKILVLCDAKITVDDWNGNFHAKIVRDSTDINVGDSGTGCAYVGYGYQQDKRQNSVAVTYLDSPSTTSAVTYALQFKVDSAEGTVYINTTSNNSGYTASSIVLMEIGA
jgi:hypothetical protein